MKSHAVEIHESIEVNIDGEISKLEPGVYYLPYGHANRLSRGKSASPVEAKRQKDLALEELPKAIGEEDDSFLEERTVAEVKEDIVEIDDEDRLERLLDQADRKTAVDAIESRLEELRQD